MPIILNQFGGMIPKVDGRSLPPEAAQEAHNVNIAGGKLSPINVPGPFAVLHDPDTGKMKSMIPAGNIISIDEPSPPVISEKIKLFRPMDWTGTLFTMGLWVSYYDQNDSPQTDLVTPTFVSGSGRWEYTEDGIVWKVSMTGKTISAKKGFYYQSYGLKFGMSFDADTKYYGGPDATYEFPSGSLSWSSPEWPDFSMPLTAPIDYSGYANDGDEVYTGERYTYGHLQLVSINAPRPIKTIDQTLDYNGQPLEYDGTSVNVDIIEAGEVEFHFKNNYLRNTQVFVNYVSSAIDQRTSEGAANIAHTGAITRVDMKDIEYGTSDIPATGYVRLTNAAGEFEDVTYTSYGVVDDVYRFTVSTTLTYSYAEDDDITIIDLTTVGKEGPASELSELITVDPGELLSITATRDAKYNRQKLYKSSSDAAFRILDDELETDTYIDTFIENLGDPLPPNGNYPQDTLAEAIEGSIIIAGNISMTFHNSQAWPSEPYKQWVYPEEYAYPLDGPFLAAVSFGASAVVFTGTHPITGEVGKVFMFSAQNPGHMYRTQITADKPLLNKRSLCVVDGTAFYATTDGLMAVSPGGIQNITEGLFTRSQWLAYEPSLMSSWTADNSVFVVGLSGRPDAINFRFDLGEGGGVSTFSTYDCFIDGDMYWKSKIFPEPKLTAHRNYQVIADGFPVELTLIGNGGEAKETILVPDEEARMLPRMKRCRNWEVEIRGRSTVSHVAIAGSIKELNS